jgi:hypothetical protein
MKVINETKGKVSIRREGMNIVLFPGESTNLNRIQLSKVRELVDYFGLTVKEGKDVTPLFHRKAPKRTVQQIETIVEPKIETMKRTVVPEEIEDPKLEIKDPVEQQLPPEVEAMKEDYDGKTAAELRELCKSNGLTISGNRKTLINRLVEHFTG